MTHTFAEGQGAIPANFPLPIYPEATTTGSVSASGDSGSEQAHFLMLSTDDPVDKVSKWYEEDLKAKGWNVDGVQTLPNLVSITASKGELEANVMISSEGDKTTINLSASKEGSGEQGPQPENFSPNKVTPPTD